MLGESYMIDRIAKIKEEMEALGYICDDRLAKYILTFMEAGKSQNELPTMLLTGPAGAGKTSLAEIFSKLIDAKEEFVQCYVGMGKENFHMDIDVKAVMQNDSEGAVKPGILLKAIQSSYENPVVLVLDEFDKARPEVDAFLLDFIQNGRLTTGVEEYKKGPHPIYVFITSNQERNFSDALNNRCRKVDIPRPDREKFLKILNLPEDHYLGYIFDACPEFSIRQAKAYLEDLTILGTDFDPDLLEQHITGFKELNIDSLEKIEMLRNSKKVKEFVDTPKIKYLTLNIDMSKQVWMDFFSENKEMSDNIELYSYQYSDYPSERLVVYDFEQLVRLNHVRDEDDSPLIQHRMEAGYVKCDLADIEDKMDIMWLGKDTTKNDNVRYGVFSYDSTDDEYRNIEKIARIKSVDGETYIYIDDETSIFDLQLHMDLIRDTKEQDQEQENNGISLKSINDRDEITNQDNENEK